MSTKSTKTGSFAKYMGSIFIIIINCNSRSWLLTSMQYGWSFILIDAFYESINGNKVALNNEICDFNGKFNCKGDIIWIQSRVNGLRIIR